MEAQSMAPNLRIQHRLFLVALTLWFSSSALAQEVANDKGPGTTGASDSEPGTKAKAVVPVFKLNGAVLETPLGDDPLFGALGAEPLKDLVARLEQARDDKEVAAVVVLFENFSIGIGQL
jgi:hypothetical protein